MGTISLRLNDKDNGLIRKYAELHNVDLSTFIRQAVIEEKLVDCENPSFYGKELQDNMNDKWRYRIGG